MILGADLDLDPVADAAAEDGLFVARGRTVTVTRIEGGVLYCTPQERKTE